MVVDIGQVLDVDANVDRCQGVVWEGIPEKRFDPVGLAGGCFKKRNMWNFFQQYKLGKYWKQAILETALNLILRPSLQSLV